MGLEVPDIPDDYGYGDDCLHCWPAGKTPNYVFIRFWDITPCPGIPAPPNGYCFVCKQDPLKPCRFFGTLDFNGLTWLAQWVSWAWPGVDPISEIQLNAQDVLFSASFYEEGIPCQQDYAVNFCTCPGWGGTGGHAHVTVYVDPIIIALTSEYHFVTTPGVLYEFDDCGMDHRWYRLCHKIDHTNIMILLDVEELELPW